MAITNANPVPVADARTVGEDSGATTFDVLANDSDAEGDAIEITAVTDPPHGSVAIVQGAPDVVTYSPDADYCSADRFSYTVTGGASASVSVSVTCVDDPADAVDDARSVGEDSGATSFDVLSNDTDVDSGAPSITGISDPAHGTVAVVPGAPDEVTYAPDADYCDESATDDFTYTIDGGDTAFVTVAVTCVDDAPVAVDDSRTVAEDSGATSFNVVANDTDVDGGALEITDVADPAHGTASVVQGAPDVISYAPDAGWCGADAFGYTVSGGNRDVSVTVSCVDDPPTAVDDARTVAEDSSATSLNVVANDTDADGGPLEITDASAPSHGAVSIVQGTPDVVSYTPDANYCGTDEFGYSVNGGDAATVSVTVTCIDDAPVAVDDSRSVAEDSGATSFNVVANDTDGDGGRAGDHRCVCCRPRRRVDRPGDPRPRFLPPDADYCGTTLFAYTVRRRRHRDGHSCGHVRRRRTDAAVDDSRTVAEDWGATPFNVLANDTDIDGWRA